jgi:hypothetical protein
MKITIVSVVTQCSLVDGKQVFFFILGWSRTDSTITEAITGLLSVIIIIIIIIIIYVSGTNFC